MAAKLSSPSPTIQSDAAIDQAPSRESEEHPHQIFAVIVWLLGWSLAILGPVSTILLLFTRYWLFAFAYLSWIYVVEWNIGREGGRPSEWFRNLEIWKWFVDYFPMQIVKTAELDPSINYLICAHPHGAFISGLFGNFSTEGTNISRVFPGITFQVITVDYNLRLPLVREFWLMGGAVSADRASLDYVLSKKGTGIGAILVPGGGREAAFTQPRTNIIYLKRRKGFVRVAIENGTPLVPMYNFGETDIFAQPHNPPGSLLRRFQEKCNDLISAAPIFILGRGIFPKSFGFLPHRKPITSVVGAPIPVVQMTNPPMELIDQLHEQYMKALSDLYYAHREKYGHLDSELIIL